MEMREGILENNDSDLTHFRLDPFSIHHGVDPKDDRRVPLETTTGPWKVEVEGLEDT